MGSRDRVVQKQQHKQFACGYSTCSRVLGISLLEAKRSLNRKFRLITGDRKVIILVIKDVQF